MAQVRDAAAGGNVDEVLRSLGLHLLSGLDVQSLKNFTNVAVRSATFDASDRYLLFSSISNGVSVWDIANDREVSSFPANPGPVVALPHGSPMGAGESMFGN